MTLIAFVGREVDPRIGGGICSQPDHYALPQPHGRKSAAQAGRSSHTAASLLSFATFLGGRPTGRSHPRRRGGNLYRGQGRLNMDHRGVWHLFVAATIAGSLAGCDYLPFNKTAQTDLDDEFGDLEDPESSTSEDFDESDQSVPDLALKLQIGQRFPLIKTVEQRVTQVLPAGLSVGHSRLDLHLSLIVEEVRANQRRFGVRYHRVRYQQDLGGHTVEYNSDQPPLTIAPEALPYAALKDNGFSFWLGADNQVLELVGFGDFLNRCVQHVPADQRSFVMQQLQAMRTEDGLANFVDDSIGLLPGAAAAKASNGLRIGSSWDLPARAGAAGAGSPGSMRCLLKDLTEKTAEISLAGSIGPSTYVDDLRRVTLTVRSGQCTGICTVDRTTGMPTRSRVERTLDMTAQLPDGTEIPQRKEVVTTVMAFLEQGPSRQTTGSPAVNGQLSVARASGN